MMFGVDAAQDASRQLAVMPMLRLTTSDATRCRYKTGRCTNARVLKPNGTQLLLCEYHREQQNETKKRSDMKYRVDRAQKRSVIKQQRKLVHIANKTIPARKSRVKVSSRRSPPAPPGIIKPWPLGMMPTRLMLPPPTTPTTTVGPRTEVLATKRGKSDLDELQDGQYALVTALEPHLLSNLSPLSTPLASRWHPDEVKLLGYFIF